MFDTVIVSGGNLNKDFALTFLKKIMDQTGREHLRLVAADKGLEFFMDAGICPDEAVGDFDSISETGKLYLNDQKNLRTVRLKPEKDDSDTQSAVNLAIDQGARELLLLGATGTRLDHVLANMELLALGKKRGARISIADSRNYITLAENGMTLEKENQWGKYVSFFPLGGDVDGLTLEGFRYPLREYLLRVTDCGLTVSNEIRDDRARVWFRSGMLMMLMTKD